MSDTDPTPRRHQIAWHILAAEQHIRSTLAQTAERTLSHPRVAMGALRVTAISWLAMLWLSIPAAAQISSPSEACSTEAAGIIEGFVAVLMGFVPAIATIIVLASFVGLMATRNPSKKGDIKGVRNSSIMYGWVLAPALGIIISLLSTLTGNPILECVTIGGGGGGGGGG